MQVHTFFRSHLCSELVSLTLVSGNNPAQTVTGNLEEIGEWSALILTETAVSPGTLVQINGKNHELKGFVRDCTHDRALGYFVDIGFDEESRWSEKWFAPQHLLSLCPSMKCFTEAMPRVPEEAFLSKPAHR